MATRKDVHNWTDEDEERVLAMREDGLGVDDIAAAFGLTRSAISSRIEKLRAQGRIVASVPVRPHNYISPDLIAERDARKAAYDQRDQTATFCGDPPVGFSALDRRRA